MNQPPDQPDKLPPCDIEAEKCTIGAMMLCGEDHVTFESIRRIVWRAAFYSDDCGTLFKAICDMADAGISIDPVTTRARLKSMGVFDEIGGNVFLAEILNLMPSGANGGHYAAIVAQRAKERSIIAIGARMVQRMREPLADGETQEIIAKIIAELWKIDVRGRSLSVSHISDVLERFIDAKEKGDSSGMPCGFLGLDERFLGIFAYGEYTLIAGRPSMGKSTLLRQILMNRSMAGVHVGLVAIEECEKKVAGNYFSADTGIFNNVLAQGVLTQEQFKSVGESFARMSGRNYWMTDSAIELPDVLNAMEIMVTQHGCKMIGIDHVHLIESRKSENRTQQINEISGALKQAIKRLGVSGVVAAQLSRPAERVGVPPPPRLTDLRDSGALEEHADSVVFLHREDYYRQSNDPQRDGLCQIIIAKQRNGQTGDLALRADLSHQRFFDLEPEQENSNDFNDR